MVYKIKQGEHKARPVRFGIWYEKKVITRRVTFFPSCRYTQTLPEDYKDTNKLFGIGYFPDHHIDSARFGWYYSNDFAKIIPVAYTYVNGVREQIDLTYCKIAYPYRLALIIEDGLYKFRVYDESNNNLLIGEEYNVPFTHKKKWAYPMNPFFGGDHPAPHDMKIDITKI